MRRFFGVLLPLLTFCNFKPVHLKKLSHPDCLPGLSENEFVFEGNGYVALENGGFDLRKFSQIKFSFKTSVDEGLIYFTVTPDRHFESLELRNGKVIYQFLLNSGQVEMATEKRYDDGKWHVLEVTWIEKESTLVTDDNVESVARYSEHFMSLNFKSAVYFGGFKGQHNIEGITANGFNGSVKDFQLGGTSIRLSMHTEMRNARCGCPRRWRRQVDRDAPNITLAPTDKKVVEDAVVSFFCKASGNPLPDVQWRKGGKRITATSTRYTVHNMPQGSVLRIESAKPSKDDAIFACVADNSVGEARASSRLEVYPREQMPSGYPHILQHPSLKAVEKDRNTIMPCNASGTPEPTIMWLKDYIPIDTTDPRLKVLPGGSLQILKSLESDEGKYECVAENSVGVAYSYGANLYVRVRRIPPHFSIPPENVEVVPGSSVNISCVAVGSPMPYVKWRLGALELTPEDEVPLGKNVLTLSDVRETANYTCVAESDLGSIEADVEVRVKGIKGMPKPPTGLVAYEVTATSVKLAWNLVTEDSVESYILQYKQKHPLRTKYDEVSNITGTDYTIHGLSAYTVYEFRVLAVNNIGRGTPSNPLNVSTGEMLPGRIRYFSNTTYRSDGVRLEWHKPDPENGMITSYIIRIDHPGGSKDIKEIEVPGNQLSRELSSFDAVYAGETYNFSIFAKTNAGGGPVTFKIVTLKESSTFNAIYLVAGVAVLFGIASSVLALILCLRRRRKNSAAIEQLERTEPFASEYELMPYAMTDGYDTIEEVTAAIEELERTEPFASEYEVMPCDEYDTTEEVAEKSDILFPNFPSRHGPLPSPGYSGLMLAEPNPPGVYSRMDHKKTSVEDEKSDINERKLQSDIDRARPYLSMLSDAEESTVETTMRGNSYLDLRGNSYLDLTTDIIDDIAEGEEIPSAYLKITDDSLQFNTDNKVVETIQDENSNDYPELVTDSHKEIEEDSEEIPSAYLRITDDSWQGNTSTYSNA